MICWCCMARPVDQAWPCGHLSCGPCSELLKLENDSARNPRSRCGICQKLHRFDKIRQIRQNYEAECRMKQLKKLSLMHDFGRELHTAKYRFTRIIRTMYEEITNKIDLKWSTKIIRHLTIEDRQNNYMIQLYQGLFRNK